MTTDLPGRELGDPLSKIGRLVGKGRVPGNVEDDAEERNMSSKQSSLSAGHCMYAQANHVSLLGLGFEDSSNALNVWGSKLLSMEGKGITPVDIDTRERALLSSCSDIWLFMLARVWRHRAPVLQDSRFVILA
jgi:hypothetical protein